MFECLSVRPPPTLPRLVRDTGSFDKREKLNNKINAKCGIEAAGTFPLFAIICRVGAGKAGP